MIMEETTQTYMIGLFNGSNRDYSYLAEREMDALTIISLVTGSLSLFGSSSVLICSIVNKRVCCPEVFPTFNLSLADLLSSLFLVVSSTLFLLRSPSYPGAQGPCGYIMATVTSCYTSSFFLTISYALEALFRFRRRLVDGTRLDALNAQVVSNRWMYLFYALCWLIPLTLAIVLMDVIYSMKNHYDGLAVPTVNIMPKQCSSCLANFRFNERYCWEEVDDGDEWHTVIRLIFLIPLILVMVINMVLYFLIGRVFRQVSMRRGLLGYHQRQEESLLKRKAVLYQGVFMICWFPSVVLGIISFTDGYQMEDYYWLLLVQAILGPLQGMFNCFLYGWRRDSFRRVLSERSALLSTNRATAIWGCLCICFWKEAEPYRGEEEISQPVGNTPQIDNLHTGLTKNKFPFPSGKTSPVYNTMSI